MTVGQKCSFTLLHKEDLWNDKTGTEIIVSKGSNNTAGNTECFPCVAIH